MSDADALLAAIRAAPDDDAPRLIYADWLEEHGQPERAEFIRAQCELACNDSPTLRQREVELVAEHHVAFAGPLAAPGLRFRFERGFVIAFGHTGVFAATDPRSSPRTRTLLRFFPDGIVVHAVTMSLPLSAPQWFHRQSPQWPKVTYVLTSIAYPAEIEFVVPDEDYTRRFEGTLDRECLRVDVRHLFPTKRRSRVHSRYRQRYSHIALPGFDSFQDSPQDAV